MRLNLVSLLNNTDKLMAWDHKSGREVIKKNDSLVFFGKQLLISLRKSIPHNKLALNKSVCILLSHGRGINGEGTGIQYLFGFGLPLGVSLGASRCTSPNFNQINAGPFNSRFLAYILDIDILLLITTTINTRVRRATVSNCDVYFIDIFLLDGMVTRPSSAHWQFRGARLLWIIRCDSIQNTRIQS